MSAQSDYKAAAAALEKFCNEETNFAVEILTENYPLSVKFTPNAQMSLFDSENYTVDETERSAIYSSASGSLPAFYPRFASKWTRSS